MQRMVMASSTLARIVTVSDKSAGKTAGERCRDILNPRLCLSLFLSLFLGFPAVHPMAHHLLAMHACRCNPRLMVRLAGAAIRAISPPREWIQPDRISLPSTY